MGRSFATCLHAVADEASEAEGAAGADAVGQSEKRVVAGRVMSGDRCCHDFGGGVDVLAHEGAVEADAMAQAPAPRQLLVISQLKPILTPGVRCV